MESITAPIVKFTYSLEGVLQFPFCNFLFIQKKRKECQDFEKPAAAPR